MKKAISEKVCICGGKYTLATITR